VTASAFIGGIKTNRVHTTFSFIDRFLLGCDYTASAAAVSRCGSVPYRILVL